ncbi:MAG: hypothetical protein NVS1B9_12200 [Solirubrobacteraceae bacterium]
MSVGPRTLCLGEVLVDLVCERHVDGWDAAGPFAPHLGGSGANVAVGAAQRGSRIALAGGLGEDAWGDWLRAQLAREGVELTWLRPIANGPTPLACVTVDSAGEPDYIIYAESVPLALAALEPEIESAVAACDALSFGSNPLVGEVDRRVSDRARRRAIELGRPLILDANLRLERWASAAAARAAVLEVIQGARLLRTNRAEAALLAGTGDIELAAERLLTAGAEAVVITLGADGALLRGPARRDVPGIPAAPRSTVGAGDAVTAALVAALTEHDYDIGCLAAALPAAVAAGARATERWGAVQTRHRDSA